MRKQSDYLDHQRRISEQVLEQNRTFEEMIAKQYVVPNRRRDEALARIAQRLEFDRPGPTT